jgi:hypothetical protein
MGGEDEVAIFRTDVPSSHYNDKAWGAHHTPGLVQQF